MKRIICWFRGHDKQGFSVNGNLTYLETCSRCPARWWRGSRTR